nr:hypothetical protein [Kineosporia sp. NBRC 101731]
MSTFVPSSMRLVTAPATVSTVRASGMLRYAAGQGMSGAPYRPCGPLWSSGTSRRSKAQTLSYPMSSKP